MTCASFRRRYFEIAQAFERTPEVADFGDDDSVCVRGSIGTTLNIILKRTDGSNILTQVGPLGSTT